jgi:hypothetical protein
VFGISRLLRPERNSDADLTARELLQRTPLDRLEQTVKALKKQRSAADVREAMIHLIAVAPLAHFGTLKQIYMVHCADVK